MPYRQPEKQLPFRPYQQYIYNIVVKEKEDNKKEEEKEQDSQDIFFNTIKEYLSNKEDNKNNYKSDSNRVHFINLINQPNYT